MIAIARLVPKQPLAPAAEAATRSAHPAARLVFDFSQPLLPISLKNFSGAEPIGRWTNGTDAEIELPVPVGGEPVLLLGFDVRALIQPKTHPEQRVTVSVNGLEVTTWSFQENILRRRVLVVQRQMVEAAGCITLGFQLHDCVQPVSLGLPSDERFLGIMIRRVMLEEAAEMPPPESLFWQFGRAVGGESAKCFDRRIETGFWSRFVTGPKVLDIGSRFYGGAALPILESAIGVDMDYPGYDGKRLPFEDGSQDAVFSSHCLEHIADYVQALQDWFRVVRTGGHLITIVPSAALYERKRRPPSRWNTDHKRFYSPASLLAEFEQALASNSYRVRYLEENDEAYRYEIPLDQHPFGAYEIVLVIQKIEKPAWQLEE